LGAGVFPGAEVGRRSIGSFNGKASFARRETLTTSGRFLPPSAGPPLDTSAGSTVLPSLPAIKTSPIHVRHRDHCRCAPFSKPIPLPTHRPYRINHPTNTPSPPRLPPQLPLCLTSCFPNRQLGRTILHPLLPSPFIILCPCFLCCLFACLPLFTLLAPRRPFLVSQLRILLWKSCLTAIPLDSRRGIRVVEERALAERPCFSLKEIGVVLPFVRGNLFCGNTYEYEEPCPMYVIRSLCPWLS